jgi:hypothetical protein
MPDKIIPCPCCKTLLLGTVEVCPRCGYALEHIFPDLETVQKPADDEGGLPRLQRTCSQGPDSLLELRKFPEIETPVGWGRISIIFQYPTTLHPNSGFVANAMWLRICRPRPSSPIPRFRVPSHAFESRPTLRVPSHAFESRPTLRVPSQSWCPVPAPRGVGQLLWWVNYLAKQSVPTHGTISFRV